MKTSILTLFTILAAQAVLGQSRIVKSADIEHEKRLQCDIEVDYGTIFINPVGGEKLFSVNAKYNKEKANPSIDFERDGSDASLIFKSNSKKNKVVVNEDDENSDNYDSRSGVDGNEFSKSDFLVNLDLGKNVEHELIFTIGAGTANIDLSGLKLADLEISSGAAKINLQCNVLNPNVIRDGRISTGVGDIRMEGLMNLNFKRLQVEGGVGKFDLTFNGKSTGKHFVNVETGIGTVVIRVPKSVGVRLIDDSSFFSNLSVPRNYKKKGGVYQTENYQDAESTIEFTVTSGMGSITFETAN